MDAQSLAMFGWSLTKVNVLCSQKFGKASLKSCDRGSVKSQSFNIRLYKYPKRSQTALVTNFQGLGKLLNKTNSVLS